MKNVCKNFLSWLPIWRIRKLSYVADVAELSIGLLTCLKLCRREFQSHCGVFDDSEVSGVDIIAS